MSADAGNGARISVSEDKLRLLFAEFKLELVKELSAYATLTTFEKWRDEFEGRLRTVEATRSGGLALGRAGMWFIGTIGVSIFLACVTLIAAALSGRHP